MRPWSVKHSVSFVPFELLIRFEPVGEQHGALRSTDVPFPGGHVPISGASRQPDRLLAAPTAIPLNASKYSYRWIWLSENSDRLSQEMRCAQCLLPITRTLLDQIVFSLTAESTIHLAPFFSWTDQPSKKRRLIFGLRFATSHSCDVCSDFVNAVSLPSA
jgi:hypothetical protein